MGRVSVTAVSAGRMELLKKFIKKVTVCGPEMCVIASNTIAASR